MNRKLLFVFNPHSGRAQLKNKLVGILDLFVKHGYEVTIHPTQAKLDAKQVVMERAGQYDLLVCSGGDGTMNEVVDGLMEIDPRPNLGYIPAGTVNDFASSLHISRDMMKAAELVMTGKPFACDIGGFNREYFTYVAAFGLFTDVAYQTPQQSKNMLGRMAYILEGAKRLSNIQSYHIKVEHDQGVIEDDFIFGLVTNSTSVGGFKGYRGSDVKLDDGLFEVSLIKTPANAIELQMIIGALMMKEINKDFITTFHTSRLTLTSEEEVPWTLDGEYGGTEKEVQIVNHPKAIHILVNPDVITERTGFVKTDEEPADEI
jgi:diacylglycerol kinase (ATP)